MNIVVMGGTGFIGQAIADLYIKAGHHVGMVQTGHRSGNTVVGRICNPSG